MHARQRPKIEQYEGFFALVAYAARPNDARVDLHEIRVYVSRDLAITIRHDGDGELADLRERPGTGLRGAA